MEVKEVDVVIVGAGAAGLMAALEIALTGRQVAVIEADSRTGGRMHTINNPVFQKPVEMGAEFVHGDLPVTLQLFQKAGIKKYKATGETWESKKGKLQKGAGFEGFDDLEKKFKNLKEDLSVADFMRLHLTGDAYADLRSSLTGYVQGYYAGDVAKASTYALFKELTTGEDVAYRVEGGYQKLVSYLESECRNRGVLFYLSEPVQEIKWSPLPAEVITTKKSIWAYKVLVTVSIGVLQTEAIRFSPTLPQKTEAIKQLGYGHVVKLNLQFTDAFWKDTAFTQGKNLSALNFLFSQQTIPTWWTQHPKKETLLVGWLAGPPAEAFTMAAKETIVERGMESLAQILNLPVTVLKEKLLQAEWYNWSADNHFCGAYSYNVVNSEVLIKTILQPVAATIYFAGEGLHYGNEMGTVEGALVSGRDVAHGLIAGFHTAE